MNKDHHSERPVIWVGASRKDLRKFPDEVKGDIGFALSEAQLGKTRYNAKYLKGYDGVMEIVSDYDTDTYRMVYAVKLGEAIYVLHAFQKKSKHGRSTPPKDMKLIEKRLKEARIIEKERAK